MRFTGRVKVAIPLFVVALLLAVPSIAAAWSFGGWYSQPAPTPPPPPTTGGSTSGCTTSGGSGTSGTTGGTTSGGTTSGGTTSGGTTTGGTTTTSNVGGSSTSPAGSKLFGVNEAELLAQLAGSRDPGQLPPSSLSLHSESQRWQLDWQAVEPNAPVNGVHTYNLAAFDPMYQADIAAGIRPLIIVTNAPKWAWPTNAPTGPGSPGWGFPPGRRAPRRLVAFLGEVARHYPQAAGIEIWNEPNHPAYWGRGYSSNYPDAAYYSQMLQQRL